MQQPCCLNHHAMAHVPDLPWTPLRAAILSIPGPRLSLIPSLAGSVWFVTLAGLLLTWIARGMPRYPGQRNPDVALAATNPILSYSHG